MNPRKLPFRRQPRMSSICTAACIAMLLDEYEGSANVEEIWNCIKAQRPGRPDQFYCANNNAIDFFITRGYQAAGVSAKDVRPFIESARSIGLELIINHKMQGHLDVGHASLFVYLNGKDVYVNDPNKKKPCQSIEIDYLERLMRPHRNEKKEVTAPNVFLAINFGDTLDEISVDGTPCFADIIESVNAVLDYKANAWKAID